MSDSSEIILASASPRRQQLLAILRLRFEVIPAHIDEAPLPDETPVEHVARLARSKALAVAEQERDRWIIAADTIVFLDGEILGKPADAEEAYRMLQKLSGREHTVMTGIFLVHPSNMQSYSTVVKSFVKIKELSDAEISGYIRTGEPFDKAGAYAIQGIGMFMVEKVRGSYTNVIGLPMCELVNALKHVGAIRFLE